MAPFAFVTLLTTDSYLPGALVTAHSVRQAEGPDPAVAFDTVCLVTPETVSVQSIRALRKAFTLVVGVEEIRSDNRSELALLGRRDLASSLTKLHLFRLIQYRKLIFLDADTLVLRPLSHLFSLPHGLAASPDSGWPDCFNSGVMVCSPSTTVFEDLLSMAEDRGSWDGGDQGLLNDYFADWHRLSFTYNVTPSAYYTYAPAYRRHGHKISVVHFIGSQKPWHRLSRPRSTPSAPAGPDYHTLVDRWYDAYEAAYGPVPTSTLTSTGPPPVAFKVPTYAAAWDSPKATRYVAPTTDQLKAMFTRSSSGAVSDAFSNPELIQGDGAEGAYLSLPMPGRPSLIRRILPPPPVAAPPPQEVAPPLLSPGGKTVRFAPSPPRSPPHSTWDPARGPPPSTGYQMSQPFLQHYDAAWDQPTSSQAKVSFRPPSTYGSVPKVTHQDYSRVASTAPDSSAVKAVFPWERPGPGSEGGKPSRVFPDDGRDGGFRSGLPDLSKARSPEEMRAQSPQGFGQGESMTMRYVNAWDSDPSIKRYAAALVATSSPSSSSRSATVGSGEGGGGEEGSSKQRGPKQHHLSAARFSASESRESDASSRDGDDEDDDRHDGEESDFGSPFAPRVKVVIPPHPAFPPSSSSHQADGRDGEGGDPDRTPNGRPSGSNLPTPKAFSLALAPPAPEARRPHHPHRTSASASGAASPAGSVSRLPTNKTMILAVPSSLDPSSAAGAAGRGPTSPGLAPDAVLRPKDLREKARGAPPVSPLFPPARPTGGGPAAVGLGADDGAGQASTSSAGSGGAGPPTRVFSPTTDTTTLKKSGMDALKRFVQDMERNGNGNGNGGTNGGNGSGSGSGSGSPAGGGGSAK